MGLLNFLITDITNRINTNYSLYQISNNLKSGVVFERIVDKSSIKQYIDQIESEYKPNFQEKLKLELRDHKEAESLSKSNPYIFFRSLKGDHSNICLWKIPSAFILDNNDGEQKGSLPVLPEVSLYYWATILKEDIKEIISDNELRKMVKDKIGDIAYCDHLIYIEKQAIPHIVNNIKRIKKLFPSFCKIFYPFTLEITDMGIYTCLGHLNYQDIVNFPLMDMKTGHIMKDKTQPIIIWYSHHYIEFIMKAKKNTIQMLQNEGRIICENKDIQYITKKVINNNNEYQHGMIITPTYLKWAGISAKELGIFDELANDGVDMILDFGDTVIEILPSFFSDN